jgi:gluconate 2-dehydrogenase gamma chain
MNQRHSRREFISSAGAAFSTGWLALNWSSIAAAAHHAEASAITPTTFRVMKPADAADVEALTAQIIPSGTTPGAREARVVYFIDQGLATFFATMSKGFTAGLADFQQKFASSHAGKAFAQASSAEQIAHLQTVESGEFFQMARMLTVLGMFSSPQYGGNYQGLGWKAMGFVDEHAFVAPFGYYDKDYPGFVPYTDKVPA